MKSPKIERFGLSARDPATGTVLPWAAGHYQVLWRGRRASIKGCDPQLGDGVAIAAKNRLALMPAAADLSGGASRRNPDAARRLEIVGGLNFKLEQWQIARDNKQFASGFYEVC
jgi:hypothetical protein